MEIRVKERRVFIIICYILFIFSTSQIFGADVVRIGLMPVFYQQNPQETNLQTLYKEKVYIQVYKRVEELVRSSEFSQLYMQRMGDHAPLEIVPLYDENALFTCDALFSMEQRTLTDYIRNRYDLDYIIYGDFTSIGDISIIKIIRIDPTDERVTIYSNIITSDTLEVTLDTMFRKIIETITNCRTGVLKIENDRDFPIQLQIDNAFLSQDNDLLEVLPQDTYDIEIIYDNQTIDTNRITINQEQQTLVVNMNEPITTYYYMLSHPSEAAVYVDTIYIGESPIVFENERRGDRVLEFEKPSYVTDQITVENKDNQTLSYELRPDWMARNDQISYGRIQWYNALGGFIITLPISIISKFLYDNTQEPIWKATQGLGITLSVSTGIQSILRLLDYYHRID